MPLALPRERLGALIHSGARVKMGRGGEEKGKEKKKSQARVRLQNSGRSPWLKPLSLEEYGPNRTSRDSAEVIGSFTLGKGRRGGSLVWGRKDRR